MKPGAPPNTDAAVFASTHWSVVLLAKQKVSPEADTALATLCETYWYPLYAFVRRQGHNVHEAQDLTQEFFSRFLAKSYLNQVDAAKGKFRSFLLASMKHFLANEWDRAKASKRGGGRKLVSLDDTSAEERYVLEPADDMTPEKLYHRRWALTLLSQTLTRLRQEFEAAGKATLFDALKGCLTGEMSVRPYAEIGQQHGLSEGAIKIAVHRMRQRYGDLLRLEVAGTVATQSDVEEELRHLLSAMQ
jgi:RNA polymerase sigma-70 factor (ECF subfamily)